MPARGGGASGGRHAESRRARAFPPTLKRFGQHFLNDRSVLERIVDALELTGTETVVEIGPGRGSLTDLLVARAGKLVGIEIDRALAAGLAKRYESDERVQIVQGDVLELDLPSVAGRKFALVGNVPYYITTPIIFQALRPPRAARAVLLVQREVADRVAAEPGSSAYGALSVNVQAVARAEVLFRVPASAFSPPPKVESAVIRLTPLENPLVAEDQILSLQTFVQSVFSLRRKQLHRVLRSVSGLSSERVDVLLERGGWPREIRPETFSPREFVRLFELVGTGH